MSKPDKIRALIRRYFFWFAVVILLLWLYQVKYKNNLSHWTNNNILWYTFCLIGVIIIVLELVIYKKKSKKQ